MRLAPDRVLVATWVAWLTTFPEEIERAADGVDRMVRDRFPEVRHVFLNPAPNKSQATVE